LYVAVALTPAATQKQLQLHIMSDIEADMKREEELKREEDERLDTAEDERRGDDATEEVRHASLPSDKRSIAPSHAKDKIATRERLPPTQD
jgi:polyadenylate-binding protein 2